MVFSATDQFILNRGQAQFIGNFVPATQKIGVGISMPGVNGNTVIAVVQRVLLLTDDVNALFAVVIESQPGTTSGLYFPPDPETAFTGGWFVRAYAVNKPVVTNITFTIYRE